MGTIRPGSIALMAAVFPVVCIAANASAASITVLNPSFETPDVTTDNDSNLWTNTHPTSWETSQGGEIDETFTSGYNMPSAPDGHQWLFFYTSGNSSSYAYQNIGTIQANQVYTMSVVAGDDSTTSDDDGHWTAGLYAWKQNISLTPVAVKTDTDVTMAHQAGDPAGTSTGVATITFNTAINPLYNGYSLYVQLSAKSSGGVFRPFFDDVQVSVVPTPEPGSALLLGLGALMMLKRRHRVM